MAQAKGVSHNTVQRLWRANDIKPHVTRTFKISNDKKFEAKFWDVIGLYLDPPERALVLRAAVRMAHETGGLKSAWQKGRGRSMLGVSVLLALDAVFHAVA